MRGLAFTTRLGIACAGMALATALTLGVAVAQTDEALGCSYSVAPSKAGPAGHVNPLAVTLDGCSWDWDFFELDLAGVTSITGRSGFEGFDCLGAGVKCYKEGGSRVSGTVRPQCPSGTITATLTVGDSRTGLSRTGAPKTIECTPPPAKVLPVSSTIRIQTLVDRGMPARFRCKTACRAEVFVSVYTSRCCGYEIGAKTFRRSRGTHRVRVKLDRSERRRLQRRRRARLSVSTSVTGASGEGVGDSQDVMARR